MGWVFSLIGLVIVAYAVAGLKHSFESGNSSWLWTIVSYPTGPLITIALGLVSSLLGLLQDLRTKWKGGWGCGVMLMFFGACTFWIFGERGFRQVRDLIVAVGLPVAGVIVVALQIYGHLFPQHLPQQLDEADDPPAEP